MAGPCWGMGWAKRDTELAFELLFCPRCGVVPELRLILSATFILEVGWIVKN